MQHIKQLIYNGLIIGYCSVPQRGPVREGRQLASRSENEADKQAYLKKDRSQLSTGKAFISHTDRKSFSSLVKLLHLGIS